MPCLNKKKSIKFNKVFYKKGAIEETIKAFNDLCDCEINENENYFLVSLQSNQPDLENLNFEFANYVLALMK